MNELIDAIKYLHKSMYVEVPVKHYGNIHIFDDECFYGFKKYDAAHYKVSKHKFIFWILKKVRFI